MDGIVFQQPLRSPLSTVTPTAGESGRSHLHDAALFYPFDHPLQALLQNGIALGMRQDRCDSLIRELGEALTYLHRHTVVAQFHEQVMAAVDAVALRAR